MVLLLAEVSMNGQPHSSARAWPSLDDTSRSLSRSTLFPTRITGTFSYLRTDTDPQVRKTDAEELYGSNQWVFVLLHLCRTYSLKRQAITLPELGISTCLVLQKVLGFSHHWIKPLLLMQLFNYPFTLLKYPSISYTRLSFRGSRGGVACPSWHWERGKVHPEHPINQRADT